MADALMHALAGSLGSLLAMLILHPINQVRILSQVGKERAVEGRGFGKTFSMLQELSLGGFAQLYFGVGPVIAATAISQGIYFALYNSSNGMVVWRSGLSSVLATIISSPIWVATIRLQLQQTQPATNNARRSMGLSAVIGQAMEIAKNDGLLALWGGLSSSLWLCSVPIVQFWTYEILRGLSQTPDHLPTLEALVMGGLSKLFAGTITYPLQVAQSRQRANARSGSIWKELSVLVRGNGLSGLYPGFEAKVILTFLNGAFMMCFYEKILELVIWISDFMAKGS